ncbi:peptide chain release factor N(5)-glutamine methyltransferase [Aestuariibaculum suncheonense]|uniref:peptide chain release factor N(5)-glutamine methyltransferase n=1 Tax=Aestuariibaculum suncheonense TaxID=1028745 RepID=A0A8J6QJ95_9FLAO|nr:peptide chain release factor N(5)-glutamine methyltransferase [Aestuariibaculum suncheonense]MBD0835956.1 peptide chain release factor N(5)-glutamine methyltransferase [Aestuariibaculum suncheonense]
MKLKEIQQQFHLELDAIYGKEEVDSFFFLLIESFYNVSRIKLAMDTDFAVENYSSMFDALEQLKDEQPIQYILGETEFYGLSFKVNPYTLIPRPETEELVEWIVNHQPKTNSAELNILDIGTGSGCIAISLAKHIPNAKVYALDVSEGALKMAKQNAELNDVSIEFIEANILKPETWSDTFKNLKFSVIVSNPPYVREQEKQLMKPNVLNNEPHLALFVKDENPLLFYKAIAQYAVINLERGGALFFEINEFLGREMIHLLTANNFVNIQLKQDIFKKDRMIKGEKH